MENSIDSEIEDKSRSIILPEGLVTRASSLSFLPVSEETAMRHDFLIPRRLTASRRISFRRRFLNSFENTCVFPFPSSPNFSLNNRWIVQPANRYRSIAICLTMIERSIFKIETNELLTIILRY